MNQVPAVPESGHVILCGLNELGAGARALGVTLLEGSYRQERVLRSAGAQTRQCPGWSPRTTMSATSTRHLSPTT